MYSFDEKKCVPEPEGFQSKITSNEVTSFGFPTFCNDKSKPKTIIYEFEHKAQSSILDKETDHLYDSSQSCIDHVTGEWVS